ncbi:MAG: response regulator [Mucinivorans sp.]
MKLEVDPTSYKILVVDDVMSNVILLKALLKTEKYQVIVANNGAQALEIVDSELPDLILLDVMMPGMSGFEVSKKLKSSPDHNDIPIIFLTALNSHEDIVKGFQLGANDFITKPFNKDELKIRIKHQISLLEAKRIIMKQTEELRSIIIGRDKLYSVIAHDLRGPLGSIKMILNLVLCNLDSKTISQEMLDMLKMANQTTEDVFTLLDNLLKWTKSQLGRLNVAFQTINIADIVRDGTEVFTTTAELKGIHIKFDEQSSGRVWADSDMVKTVMRNLLSNAIKFSNTGGTINITIESQDQDFVTINVKDCGRGIKEEDKAKLLVVDTHFSTFGTSNEEGSGLGLLLCVDFVNKHGGRLWFESKEGEGSTFSFTLPKSKE